MILCCEREAEMTHLAATEDGVIERHYCPICGAIMIIRNGIEVSRLLPSGDSMPIDPRCVV